MMRRDRQIEPDGAGGASASKGYGYIAARANVPELAWHYAACSNCP
jgi:hypothetical protein